MTHNPSIRQRRSIRLKDYDYSEPGDYFVNICTKNKMCLFGDVSDAFVNLSPLGVIAPEEWKNIPTHYLNVQIDGLVVMPNHVHGIIRILDPRKDGASPVPTTEIRRDNACVVPSEQNPRNCSSLFSIVGSYKSGVTSRIHKVGHFIGRTIWQSRYFDHIIRDDVSYYFIQRYIELNPLMWEYSRLNPKGKNVSIEMLEQLLKERFGIEGAAAAIVLGSERIFELNLSRGAVTASDSSPKRNNGKKLDKSA